MELANHGAMATRSTNSAAADLPAPFEDVNLYASDQALQEAVLREGGAGAAKRLNGFGIVTGSAEALEQARRANEMPPRLRTHDRNGRWLGHIELDPAYRACLEMSVAEGLHAPQRFAQAAATPRTGSSPYVERAAGLYLAGQMESGHCLALALSAAAVPVIAASSEGIAALVPKLVAKTFDQAIAPIADKAAALVGLATTERGGGDGLVTTAAPATEGPEGVYRLDGHKWFVSSATADAFLVTAETKAGPSLFLVPRLKSDGMPNGLKVERLKERLGLRSDPTAEVTIDGAEGLLVGEPGEARNQVSEVTASLYLDTTVLLAGLMRFATASAIHCTEHRISNGRQLAEQHLMREVLADLALDCEAAAALAFRLARAFDRAADARAAAWRRVMTPVSKYWVAKTAVPCIAEAMECHGGNGYASSSPLPRLLCDAQGLALWQGPGNRLSLEVLETLRSHPEAIETVMEELAQTASGDTHLEAAHRRVEEILHEPRLLDRRARLLLESLAVLAAGTILRTHIARPVADAFIATRMGSQPRQSYGQALDWADTKAIVQRASPNTAHRHQ